MGSTGRRRITALVAWTLGGWAAAQFTFTPSFSDYRSFSQRTYGFVAATEQPKFTQLIERQTASAPPPANYRYALSKTDFKFTGQPTQQKSCAALASKPADGRQMAALCLQLFQKIEEQPEFRKHNLASALGVLIGLSLQVSRGTELDEVHTDSLIRGLNDLLAGGGAMQMNQGDLQASYESALMTGGLIAALAQQGQESGDAGLTKAAKGLADGVLKGFGVKP